MPVHDTVAQPRTEPDETLVPVDDRNGTADTSLDPQAAVSEGGRSWRFWRSWGWRRWLVAAVVVALVAAAATGWVLLRSGEEPAVRSITAAATVGEATRAVSASGTLEPAQSEILGFEVSGTVTAVLVDLGDTVKKDDALARVSTTLLDARLEAAQSAVGAAEDELDDAEEGGSSVVLSAAQAQLVTARDDLRAAQEGVENAVLRAPFAGQVVGLELAVGDVVGTTGSGSADSGASGMGAPAAGSTSASEPSSAGSIEVSSVDRFVVETTVSSSDLASVKKGLHVEVTGAEMDETLYGTVSEVGRVATTTSAGAAAFPVTVELTGEVEGVYGGTAATVDIIVEKRTDVLTVPTRALRSEDGRIFVVLVGADGETAQRDVEVGETYGEATEILDGLEDGDQVEMVSVQGGGTGGFRGGGGGGGLPGDGQMPPGGMPGGGMRGGMPGGGMPGGTQ